MDTIQHTNALDVHYLCDSRGGKAYETKGIIDITIASFTSSPVFDMAVAGNGNVHSTASKKINTRCKGATVSSPGFVVCAFLSVCVCVCACVSVCTACVCVHVCV